MSKKQKPPETRMVQCLLYPGGAADQIILDALEQWLPTFEAAGLEPNDLIGAMLLHASSDEEGFTDFISGYLSNYRDPNWKFDPWTGQSLPDDLSEPES